MTNCSLVLILAWIFFFGSAFGSFLNVVVWRLPQKMSLSFPASHCPKCGHPIRWYHNVPVFGWLVLHGRCFDCREPISARYPIVEFLSGLGFLLLGFTDFAFIPSESLAVVALLLAADWGVFLTLLGAGLILWDRQPLPLKLFLPILFLLPAVLLPAFHFQFRLQALQPPVAAVLGFLAFLLFALFLLVQGLRLFPTFRRPTAVFFFLGTLLWAVKLLILP